MTLQQSDRQSLHDVVSKLWTQASDELCKGPGDHLGDNLVDVACQLAVIHTDLADEAKTYLNKKQCRQEHLIACRQALIEWDTNRRAKEMKHAK